MGEDVQGRRNIVAVVLAGMALLAVVLAFSRGRTYYNPVVPGGSALESAFELYRVHMGHCTSSLCDLTSRPAVSEAAKWQGPYIVAPAHFLDDWKRPLQYRHPGVHNPDRYDLWSVGPDGVSGTSDDVVNWNSR